jgi:hypothetical protein
MVEGIRAERKMNRTADLDAALRFEIGRIEEEAIRAGEPLNVEQSFLLNHLPKDSLPQAYDTDPEVLVALVPRDTPYERVCAIAQGKTWSKHWVVDFTRKAAR